MIYLTDRSAVEADDTCGMKYWLNRKELVRGIVPKAEPLALAVGRVTHEDLQTIAEWSNEQLEEKNVQLVIDDILNNLSEDDKKDVKKMEILYRRLGWLAAFTLYIEPRIRETYDTVHIEKEIVLDRDPLWVACTPDRILRHKANGHLEYREYKTTISASMKWLHSWFYAIQLHIGLAAASEELGEKVHFAQVMGLMKGSESALDGRLVHPYVWGYYNQKTSQWSCSYEGARGENWIPMPIWEYPGGIVEWVVLCGPVLANAQFPHSPPVFLNQRMLDHWVTRRIHREQQIKVVEERCKWDLNYRAIHFEMRTKNCKPPFGDACPYLPVCWNAEAAAFPLKNGDFIPRVPHHELEILARREEQKAGQ